jgi:hypothetical protein
MIIINAIAPDINNNSVNFQEIIKRMIIEKNIINFEFKESGKIYE